MVWLTVVEHLTDHFWGGRLIALPERYAHDLWLDVLWDSGLPAFIAWTAFHLLHLLYAIRVLGKPIGNPLRWVLLGTVSSVYTSALVEPVVGASLFYFWIGLMVLGVVARLAQDWAAMAAQADGRLNPAPSARAFATRAAAAGRR